MQKKQDTIAKINKAKSWFFERINKINKFLFKKKKKNQAPMAPFPRYYRSWGYLNLLENVDRDYAEVNLVLKVQICKYY